MGVAVRSRSVYVWFYAASVGPDGCKRFDQPADGFAPSGRRATFHRDGELHEPRLQPKCDMVGYSRFN